MPSSHAIVLPLTQFQQELWLAHEALPEKHPGIYTGGKFVLLGSPDPKCLVQALAHLVEHFPILGATLRAGEGAFPVLETEAYPNPDFRYVDLSQEENPETAAELFLAQFAEEPFIPIGGQLSHFALVRLNAGCSWFLIRCFHLIIDGLAVIAHFNVLVQIYNTLQSGLSFDLGPACHWSADVEADQHYMTSTRAEKDISFWTEYLQDLPSERIFQPRTGCPDQIETIGRLEHDFSAMMVARLRDLAARLGVGVSTLFQAAHAIVISTLYDEASVCIMQPLAFGERKDPRKIHGYRVSVTPLVLKVRSDDSLATVIAQVKRITTSLMRHVRTPFQTALRRQEIWRQLSHIWDAHLNYLPLVPEQGQKDFWAPRQTPFFSRHDPVLLGLFVIETASRGVHLTVAHSLNHFSEEDARRYVQRLELVLNAADDTTPLSTLDLLLASERDALTLWQRGPQRVYAQDYIHGLFDNVSVLAPNNIAVMGEDGSRLTYAHVRERSDGIAGWLGRQNIRPGEVVAVLARRHPRLPETILGIMKAGAVYLPVDPDYPVDRIRHMLDDSGTQLILTLDHGEILPEGLSAAIESIPENVRDFCAQRPMPATPDLHAPAYLIYTSGSTGLPKGVLVPHRGFVNTIQGMLELFGISPNDRVLLFASPSFDASLADIFMALLGGACVVPVSRSLINEPWSLKEYMQKQDVSVVTFPPSYLGLFRHEDFPGLRVLITAGETPIFEDARHYATQVDYFNAYGPTEASVCATMLRVRPESTRAQMTIGRPLPNTRAYILDSQGRRKIPGLSGELYLGGEGVALGYLNRPDLNRERFLPSSFVHGERLYRTGDRATWTHDGEIALVGRVDEQVKIRGHRVEPGEICIALEGHPQVLQAFVVPVPGRGGRDELAAFLVPSDPAACTPENLRAWLCARLPEFMVPVRFHLLAQLPMSPTGKVDRQALLRQGANAVDRSGSIKKRCADSTFEEGIRTHYEAVLARDVPDVHADFFALGGDSLKAMALIRRLSQAYGCGLSMGAFLAKTSIAAMAEYISSTGHAASADHLELTQLPLSQGQFQLWVQECLSGPSARYAMPLALEIRTHAAGMDRFLKAVKLALAEQPLCHCTVAGEMDAPHFRVQPPDVPTTHVDLRQIGDPFAAARRLFDECIHRPFVLTQDLPLRLLVARVDEQCWHLLVVMHHIIGDGESLRIVLHDAVSRLRGEFRESSHRASALALERFARSERTYLSTEEHRPDLDFWRTTLLPLPKRVDLCGPSIRPTPRAGSGKMIHQTLGASVIPGLQKLADQSQTTLLGSFLGVLACFLRIRTGSQDVALAVPVGLRDEPDLFDTVGYFVNTVILRGQEIHGGDVRGSIRAMGLALREAMVHSRYPFSLLSAALEEIRDPSRTPLVDVMATHMDQSSVLPCLDGLEEISITPLDVSLRAAKFDYTFILRTRANASDELVLDYATDITTPQEAVGLLEELTAFLERTVSGAEWIQDADESVQGFKSQYSASHPDSAEASRREKTVDSCENPAGATSCPDVGVLAEAWQEVLGGARPDRDCNFFLNGGDSIKVIQLVGLLRRRGVTSLSAGRVFESPTFGELCSRLRAPRPAEDDSSRFPSPLPGDAVHLLPIQRHFSANHPLHWLKFHLAFPLRLHATVARDRLRQAVRDLPLRHEALRLVFSDTTATLLANPEPPVWVELQLPGSIAPEACVGEAARQLFSRLDPTHGPLWGAVLIHREENSERLLLLGGHHFVLDVVSLEIMRRELAWFCHHGQWPRESTPGVATWAAHLKAASPRTEEEVLLWKEICATPVGSLAGPRSKGEARSALRVAHNRVVSGFSRTGTADLRPELMATLARALHQSGQVEPIFMTMEGHGREELVPGLDISQAIGWFTSTFPLALTPGNDLNEMLRYHRRWFKGLPLNGAGYALARQGDPACLNYAPQMAFNYLGLLTAPAGDDGFAVEPQWISPDVLPGLTPDDFQSDAPVDLLVYFSSPETLCLSASFASSRIDPAWVDELLDAWTEALKMLPAYQEALPVEEWAFLAEHSMAATTDVESVGLPDPAQEGMLFQALLEAGHEARTRSYAQQITFSLDGNADEDLLVRAWAVVVNRHEALRTLFPVSPQGDFRRLVLTKARTGIDRFDLSRLPQAMAMSRRDDLLRMQGGECFDLTRGPLLSMQLFRLGSNAEDAVLEMTWRFHHLLMDGWCVGILLRELFEVYTALRRGDAPALPAAPQMSVYRHWLRCRDHEAARMYWTELLRDFSKPTLLAEKSPAQGVGEQFREVEISLDETTTNRVRLAAARMTVTVPHLLQALWSLLLDGHNSGRRDVVFGLVCSGRPPEVDGIEHMVGLFIQTLPVRIRWEEEDDLAALVDKIRRQAGERAVHEAYPLAEIQQVVGGPLFDHILVFENYPLDGIAPVGAPRIRAVSGVERHPYALALMVIPGERLACRFSFRPSLFSDEQVALLESQWRGLLQAVAQSGNMPCVELENIAARRGECGVKAALTSREIPEEFNRTARAYPRESSVSALFRQIAANIPTALACLGADGAEWTYLALDQVSESVATALCGIAPGEPVALGMPRGPEAVAVMLGILKAGGCYVPLDEKNPPHRLHAMLRTASCTWLIHWQGILGAFKPDPIVTCLDYAHLAVSTEGGTHVTRVLSDAPAYILFTSGSTGEPKGVLVPHRAILRLVCNSDFWDVAAGERVLQAGPLGFDASTLEIWGALLNGGTVCFASDDDVLSSTRLRRFLRTHRISQMWLTASLCHLLADESPRLFSSLRRLFTGGEALSPTHIAQIMAACPELEIFNGYGPTENTTFTTVHRIMPRDLEGASIPIGRPVANTRVYILREDMTLAGLGEWGEMFAAGDGLALGYVGRDDLTRQVFIDLPAPMGERAYRTGDLGRWREDGVIEFLGRRDKQVKVRGFRIELSEIEMALCRLPGVRQAVVVALGQGENRTLAAFVSTQNPDGLAGLKSALKTMLPPYMIPYRITYLETLPLTKNGKLDRAALELLAQGDEAKTTRPVEHGEGSGAEDNSALEQRIAAIFTEILGTSVNSPQADFFELGGQSLKAMRLLARINHRLGAELTLGDIMTHTTVESLALRIGHPVTSEASSPYRIATGNELKDYPLSSGQERLWFLQRMYPASTVYTVPCAVRVGGEIDPDVLQRALNMLEERHEALRLRMPTALGPEEQTGLRQHVAKAGQLRLDYRDFSTTSDPVQAVADTVNAELARPFDFSQDAPLVRAFLFRESASASVLLLMFHHGVCDGWSSEILLRDLQTAHAHAVRGTRPNWSPLAVRYVDYALWQREFLASPECTALRERWLQRMTPLPEPLKLPTDKPRPAVRGSSGDVLPFVLEPRIVDGLKACATREGVTLFPVLAALVATFLYRHTGQRDVVVGVPVAGRVQEEIQGLVGFFVNTIPLRQVLDPDAGFQKLVRQISLTMRETLADQLFPLEALINALNMPREASRNPLFDVLVALEDESWTTEKKDNLLPLVPYSLPHRQSKMDLSFYFRECAEGLSVHIEFSTDLFQRQTIARMAERFTILASAAPEKGAARLDDLPLLPLSELDLLRVWNDTREDWNLDSSIDACFRHQVRATPRAIALRAHDGHVLDFATLDKQVEALATALRSQGVGPETFVGVCFERGVELMVAIFAVLRTGAVYVPIVPDLPEARVASMAEDLHGCMVLTRSDLAGPFHSLGLPVLDLALRPHPEARCDVHVSAHAPAYVIFTSGSTGRPKGVMVEHGSVLNRIFWMQARFELREHDVILQKTPISFDVSVWELFWWSWTGASLALLAPGEEKDPAALIAAVARHEVTVLHFVPSMLRSFLEHLERHPESLASLRSLRLVFASGEALTAELVTRFNTLLFAANGTELHNLYGPTEATVDVTWMPCSPAVHGTVVPIGRPIANTSMHVLGDTFQPVPVGVVGELFIGGVQVARGYVNRPELTAERFLRDPFTTHGRMYRTGDLARWLPTGEIEYLGRTDDQVKIRGFRIELGEVEAALERCPGVAQAVVRVGEMGGFPALEAFLVPRTGTDFSLPVIRVHLAEFLPDAMRPAVYYRLKSIPLSSSGKADRKALQGERLGRLATETSAVQHTPTEQTVLGIWSRILPEAGIITIDQNFFEIGGSSLLLIRLHEALEEIWPGHFTLAELFVAVTIRQQSERIDGAHQPQTVLPSTRPVGTQDQAIAIIGMALRVGNHDSPDAFWSELLGGGDLTGSLPAARQQELKHMLAAIGIDAASRQFREAAYLDDISGFDCARFGMAPGDARLMDPEQRLFLETALRALEDAGYGGQSLFGAKTGVFAGASPTPTFKEAVSRSFPEQAEQGYILNVPSGMATRLGYIMNWSGPAALVDTACSSSLQAMRDACLSLHRGECDVALVGGSRILLTPLRSESTFAIETTTGHTRTFDAKADGVSAGEGAVVFVLKPLARAKADGDAIRAVILGGAVNQDGRSASIAAPNPVAQGSVIRAAAADAGIDLTSIDFFEAHGTATALGDPIEIDGLTRAFGPENHQAFIGSVKGNVGHLDAAAGAIGVAKAVLALQHGLVPRQPHFETPNPRIDFAHAPVVVAGENQRLLADRQPWRCGVSAFGLSGINVHLLLEQAPRFAYPEDDGTCFCLPLSAGSAHGLRVYVEKLMLAMAENPSWPLHAIAATLSVGREHLAVRLAIAARTREEFLNALMAWRLGKTTPDFSCAEKKAGSEALAFLGGAAPVWPAKRPVYRVHLPSAPLERVRCWPDFVPVHLSGGQGFLGQTVATPQGWFFSVPVGDKTFWPVAEHVLAGTPTLVGMAMVALVAEAMDRIGAKESIVIEGLSWLRPASAAHEAVSGLLSLRTTDGSTHAVLSVGHGDDRWDECIEAQVRTVRATPKRRDVAALGEAMQRVPRVKENADDGQERMVQVSARWDCLRRQWRSADGMESLALLVLPEDFHGDAELTAWHPALLDVAASQILDRPGLVPISCHSIHLYRPLPPRCFVHAVRHSPGNEEILHGDCCLISEQGDVLAELSGLVFVPLRRPQAQLHQLEWTEARLTEDSMEPGEILLLGQGPLCTALEEELGHQNRPFRHLPLPTDDAGREKVTGELGTASHVLYVLPAAGHCRWDLAAQFQSWCRRAPRGPLAVLVIGSGALRHEQDGVTPDAALALGLVLSLRQEEDLLRVRYVELAGEVTAQAVLAELGVEETRPVMLTAQGQRLVRELSAPLPIAPIASAKGAGCVILTGGLGAMALTLAAAVIPDLGASVALLHRGGFPPESQWPELVHANDPVTAFRAASLLRLREKEARVRLYSCDVTNRAELEQTLGRIRADMGSIGGIIHTAGVAGQGFLLGKNKRDFERVLAPKVDGTRYLHELTLQDAPRFFVLASSRTALSGAPGQTDYAAANAYLDAFAQWRRHQGLPALSINWNTWSGVGMAERWGAVDPSQPTLAADQAASVLVRALASGSAQVVVSMPGENVSRNTATPKTVSVEENPASLEERVLDIVAQGLGYETLSREDDFYAVGGDSITGMRIVNRINRELGRSISLAELFANSRLDQFLMVVRGEERTHADAVMPAPIQDDYPVSWEQLAVLRSEAVAAPHTGYNLPQFLLFSEHVDVARLEKALTHLVARHEILRTCFSGLDQELPRMLVAPAAPFYLEERRVAALDSETVRTLIRPFSLTQAPLFRAVLVGVDTLGTVFFLDIHHSIADARTVDLLLADVESLYRGKTLEPLALQQKDAAWRQHQVNEEDAARRYWLDRFSGPLPRFDLPADHPRPKRHTNRGATTGFDVPPELLPALRSLAREHNTTTFNLMLSVWSVLLGHLANTEDLVIAVAADGRDREEFADTPGMFVSLLPLRLRLEPGESWADLLRRNHGVHADALRYRSFPLNRLLGALRPPVALDRTLLAEVTFSYMNFHTVRQGPDQSLFTPIKIANPGCKADVAIFATDTEQQLSFALEYYAELFDAARMERMGAAFLDLLRQLIQAGAKSPVAETRIAVEDGTSSAPREEHQTQAPGTHPQGTELSTGAVDMVLGVFREFFGSDALDISDSFFDLGGHSLLGLQMVNRIARESGLELSVRDLFDHPSPAELGHFLAGITSSLDRIKPGPSRPDGRYPLSHDQQRLYVLHHTEGGAAAYNMSFVFRIDSPLDPKRFRRALVELCHRHETLRTAFVEEDGQLWQEVQGGVQPECMVHELPADGLPTAVRLFTEDAVLPFDLRQAPLLRVRICLMADGPAYLSLVMHHVIGDGWSMQIFFGELMTLYAGQQETLAPLDIQYRDYALWQQHRDWANDASYWRETLRGAPGHIALPTDAPTSGLKTAGVVQKMVPPELLADLRDYARRKGVSLATCILTLFAALLYRLTRQQDMVIGMGVAGRERVELEGLIGFFINILPIRVRMDDDTELAEVLEQVHRASLEALERQNYPFDLLVRDISSERGGRQTLLNVMFEYQRYGDLQRINGLADLQNPLACTSVELADLADESMPPGPQAKYDLTLFVQDLPHGCRLKAEFDHAVLTAETVTTWLAYLEMFMASATQAQSSNA